jgi:serine/threonine protein kinase
MALSEPFGVIGSTVAEKYAVEAVEGESTYAVTYRALHLASKKPVVLQVFKVLGEYDAETRGRLLQALIQHGTLVAELAASTAAIRPPRDIGPLTLGGGKWVPYIVFDWLEGTSLQTVLEADRATEVPPLPLRAAMSLLEPVVIALEVVHARGLAHLNVKPSNIFLDDAAARLASGEAVWPPAGATSCAPGAIRLLDFGTAHTVSHAFELPGAFADPENQASIAIMPSYVTAAYAAPEQFLSPHPPVGPWTDVFALAVLLTEVISGTPPNSADVGALSSGRRLTPRGCGVAVSDSVEVVFVRALASDPGKRFGSAGQFWNALRAAIGLPAFVIPPAPPLRRSLRPSDLVEVQASSAPAAVGDERAAIAAPYRGRRGRLRMLVGALGLALASLVAIWAKRSLSAVGKMANPAPASSALALAAPPPTTPQAIVLPPPTPTVTPPAAVRVSALHATTDLPPGGGAIPKASLETKRDPDGTVNPIQRVTAPETAPASQPFVTPVPTSGRPPEAVAAPQPGLVPGPPTPLSSAPPFDAATARVIMGAATNITGATPRTVAAVIGPAASRVTACYRTALPAMTGPWGGSGILHIETDESGRIISASVRGRFGGGLSPCIGGVVIGRQVPNVDTGAASADIPLTFEAR